MHSIIIPSITVYTEGFVSTAYTEFSRSALMHVIEQGQMNPQCRVYGTAISDNSGPKNSQSSFQSYVTLKHNLGTEIQTESTN